MSLQALFRKVRTLKTKKYLGLDKYPYHQPSDERVIVFVRPKHKTQMGG